MGWRDNETDKQIAKNYEENQILMDSLFSQIKDSIKDVKLRERYSSSFENYMRMSDYSQVWVDASYKGKEVSITIGRALYETDKPIMLSLQTVYVSQIDYFKETKEITKELLISKIKKWFNIKDIRYEQLSLF